MQGGLHPLAAFGHRLVGQTDNLDAHLSRCDHDLHLDGHTLYALKCNRIDPCHHGLPRKPAASAELHALSRPPISNVPQGKE